MSETDYQIVTVVNLNHTQGHRKLSTPFNIENSNARILKKNNSKFISSRRAEVMIRTVTTVSYLDIYFFKVT